MVKSSIDKLMPRKLLILTVVKTYVIVLKREQVLE